MYRTILVPVDGSALAERAVPYAEALARAAGARIIALQVPVTNAAVRAGEATMEVRSAGPEAEYLQDLQRRLVGRGLEVETAIVAGTPAQVIVQEARAREVDLLVLATHGRSGLGRWRYGSVAEDVLRQADVPLLLVPSTSRYTWPLPVCAPAGGQARHDGHDGQEGHGATEHARPFRVLVPLDGSSFAREALASVSAFARTCDAELILLRVVEPPGTPYGEVADVATYDPAPDLVDARRYLEEIAQTLRRRGHPVGIRAEVGFAAATIAETAGEMQVELIAMATHGRSGLSRLIMGSVATGVLHRVPQPLLLVRPVALRQVVSRREQRLAIVPGAPS
jgi:nucleotide-binding universal stress UspA family protein